MLSGHCVLTACDGMEAMRILEAHDGIDLLILDLHMPNMDGFKVLESLKGNERYNKLITIILAEALDDEIWLKAWGCRLYPQPIRVDLLKAESMFILRYVRNTHININGMNRRLYLT